MLSDDGVKIDRVVSLEVDDALLVERITGRMIHKGSGRSYHTKFNPPKVAGVDDVSGPLNNALLVHFYIAFGCSSLDAMYVVD